jgi:hypothetical protein
MEIPGQQRLLRLLLGNLEAIQSRMEMATRTWHPAAMEPELETFWALSGVYLEELAKARLQVVIALERLQAIALAGLVSEQPLKTSELGALWGRNLPTLNPQPLRDSSSHPPIPPSGNL